MKYLTKKMCFFVIVLDTRVHYYTNTVNIIILCWALGIMTSADN